MKQKKSLTEYLPSKNTQGIPSNYNVGAKSHQRDVQVWCIDILDWRFVGQPSSYWFSYSCPVTLNEGNKGKTRHMRLHKITIWKIPLRQIEGWQLLPCARKGTRWPSVCSSHTGCWLESSTEGWINIVLSGKNRMRFSLYSFRIVILISKQGTCVQIYIALHKLRTWI